MPNTQTTSSEKRGGRAAANRSGASKATGAQSATDERDETYGLVSVMYNALQGAETIGRYIEDARAADNEELVLFFEECKGRQNEMAMKAKRLLASQLDESTSEDDDEEDEEQ
jgi:hypothetical protein